MSAYRTLRHEREYTEAIDQLVAIDKRYADVADGLEWGIATNPECYPLLPSHLGIDGLRLAPGDGIAGLDPVRIFFVTEDDHTATLLYIERVAVQDLLNELG